MLGIPCFYGTTRVPIPGETVRKCTSSVPMGVGKKGRRERHCDDFGDLPSTHPPNQDQSKSVAKLGLPDRIQFVRSPDRVSSRNWKCVNGTSVPRLLSCRI